MRVLCACAFYSGAVIKNTIYSKGAFFPLRLGGQYSYIYYSTLTLLWTALRRKGSEKISSMDKPLDNKMFKKYATEYDPIKIGSIDATDTEPHDRALVRAINSEYSANKQVKGDPYHTIFIGRLNPRTTQDVIETEFAKFGRILYCRLVKDIVTGKSKRYAFISYIDASSVDKAVRSMHRQELERAEIIVELEAERRLRGWRPRRLGGGFGGKKESGQLRFGCTERPFRKPIYLKKI